MITILKYDIDQLIFDIYKDKECEYYSAYRQEFTKRECQLIEVIYELSLQRTKYGEVKFIEIQKNRLIQEVKRREIYKIKGERLVKAIEKSISKFKKHEYLSEGIHIVLTSRTVYLFAHDIVSPHIVDKMKFYDEFLERILPDSQSKLAWNEQDYDNCETWELRTRLRWQQRIFTHYQKKDSVFNLFRVMLEALKEDSNLKMVSNDYEDEMYGSGSNIKYRFIEQGISEQERQNMDELCKISNEMTYSVNNIMRFNDVATIHNLSYNCQKETINYRQDSVSLYFSNRSDSKELREDYDIGGNLYVNEKVARYYEPNSKRPIYMSPKIISLFNKKIGSTITKTLFEYYLRSENDFLKYDSSASNTNIPLTFTKMAKAKNKGELIELITKNKVSKKVAKLPIQLAIMVGEDLPFISPTDYHTYITWVFDRHTNDKPYFETTPLKTIYSEKGIDINLINDYINICERLNSVVNLRISSQSRMEADHIKLSRLLYTEELTVHKDYYDLNLPFQLIDDKFELVQEANLQRHCVSSYDNYINSGSCAIYWTEVESKHYTIEVKKGKNDFILAQCRGFANEDAPNEVKLKIISEIEECTKIWKKNYALKNMKENISQS